MFYAFSRSKALEFIDLIMTRRERQIPFAAKCLKSPLEACFTYPDFSSDERGCLRTPNAVKRINKNF
jgi:hypothetical protein